MIYMSLSNNPSSRGYKFLEYVLFSKKTVRGLPYKDHFCYICLIKEEMPFEVIAHIEPVAHIS